MINIALFSTLFIVIFIICFFVYYRNYDKLVVYHKYSLTVDVLVWIGATIVIIAAFLHYDAIEKYNYLLWVQIFFASTTLNIHLTRFIIGIKRHKK